MTDGCNFRCNYCSVGDPEHINVIDNMYIKRFIDGMQELLDYKKDNYLDILWHGGEPLLIHKQIYEDLISYVHRKLPNVNIKFTIQTNGSLINEEWIEFFKKYDIRPGISLDGYRELHNANRVDEDGNGTYDIVMKNIELLRKHSIDPGVLMVLNTQYQIDTDKLYDFLKNNKLNAKVHAVFPAGRASNRKDMDMVFKNYVDVLIELYRNLIKDDIDIVIDPIYSLLNSIINEKDLPECSYSGRCGHDFMCLYQDGSVSFCGRNDNTKELLYGNINEQTPLQLYTSAQAERLRNRMDELKRGSCGECGYFNLCHGGCPFESLLNTGVIESKYRHCCEWKRLLDFMYIEGLDLFREFLVKKKKAINSDIEEKHELLKEYLENA